MKYYFRTFIVFLFSWLWLNLGGMASGVSYIAEDKAKSVREVMVTVEFNQNNLAKVFSKIEEITQFSFVFDENDVNGKEFSGSYVERSVYEILRDISHQNGLTFRQVNTNLTVNKKNNEQAEEVTIVITENKTITGKVVDQEGELLIGVNVLIKESKTGVITDIDGNYRLNIPGDQTVLIFSFIGYKTMEILVGTQMVVNVVLEEDVEQLDEIIVIGYGNQIKRNISTAITNVDSKKINGAIANSFEAGMQGIAAGVQVTTSSALAGSAVRIRIRGTSSASANSEPLYVIDGIPMESGEISSSQPGGAIAEWNLQQGANTNVLASLNPADIESIEILKDAASAAIYGSRGANGVVVITTKKGKVGATKITVSGSVGFSDATHRIPLLNSEQYLTLAQKAWFNSGNDINDFWSKSGVLVDGLTEEQARATDTDWIDQVLQIGKVQDYNISASGGSNKTTFYLSANIKNQETILIGNDYQKIGTRLNLDHKISDRFKVGGKVMLTYINDEQVPTNWAGGVSNVSEMLPIWPVRKEDGTFFNLTNEHPLAGIIYRDINLKSNQILGNWYGEASITKDLTFRTEIGTNLLFNNDFHYRDGRITDHNRTVSSTVSGQRSSWNWKNILNYTKTFGSHSLDILAATEAQSSGSRTNFVFGDTFLNSTLTRPQDAAVINASGSETRYSFQSLISRINYDFNKKYLLSASLRADGSSRFGVENRWGYFPAVSLGWIVSDESFFGPMASTLNFFKVRASYGVVGNSEIGDYSSFSTYNTSIYNGNTGIVLGNIGDPRLGWELTSQLNLGITWEIFNGRISGEFDYYEKVTTDLLLPFPVSLMTGVSSVTKNIGELSNKGFDFMVNGLIIAKPNFTWETNITLNHNKNLVVSLGDELIKDGLSSSEGLGSTSIFPGHPVGVIEGVAWGGVDVESGEDTYYDLEGNLYLYSEVIEQWGSFDNFNNEEKKPIGNPWPLLTGGINNSFTYKKFYASLLITFATGQEFADGYTKQLNASFGNNKINPSTHMLDAWNSPGDDATVSRLTTNNVVWPWSDEFLYKTDYMRFRDVTLGYRTKLGNSFIKGLNVYVKLVNFFTITKAPVFFWDPEFTGVVQSRSSNNVGAGSAFKQSPQAKTILFGVSIDL